MVSKKHNGRVGRSYYGKIVKSHTYVIYALTSFDRKSEGHEFQSQRQKFFPFNANSTWMLLMQVLMSHPQGNLLEKITQEKENL